MAAAQKGCRGAPPNLHTGRQMHRVIQVFYSFFFVNHMIRVRGFNWVQKGWAWGAEHCKFIFAIVFLILLQANQEVVCETQLARESWDPLLVWPGGEAMAPKIERVNQQSSPARTLAGTAHPQTHPEFPSSGREGRRRGDQSVSPGLVTCLLR